MPDIVILSVGNPLMGDEGLAGRAASGLRARLPEGARLVEAELLGPKVVPEIEGATHLLVLDVVEANLPPGTLVRLEEEQLLPGRRSTSAHDFGVADLLVLLRQAGATPREIVLLGVQPAAIGPGTELSPAVEASVGPLVEAALEVVRRWS